MGVLTDVFDVVRDGVVEIKEKVEDLCAPMFDDMGYIYDELACLWDDDDDAA